LTNPIPYVTIRYNQRERENMGVKIGTKLEGNWGAMIPVSYGTVTGIIKSVNGVTIPTTAVVEWDDLPMENIEFARIGDAGSKVIGITLSEY
jgi:hypothetical protein